MWSIVGTPKDGYTVIEVAADVAFSGGFVYSPVVPASTTFTVIV